MSGFHPLRPSTTRSCRFALQAKLSAAIILRMRTFAAAVAIFAGFACAFAASASPHSPEGTWDLFWQTRTGPRQSGYFVFRQKGTQLSAELHGKGTVKVRGTTSGNSFKLTGTRTLVRYRVDGTWSADHMEGSFKVLNRELKFTAKRRVPSSNRQP